MMLQDNEAGSIGKQMLFLQCFIAQGWMLLNMIKFLLCEGGGF